MNCELKNRLSRHVGHHIEIVKYGNDNLSIECEDCCEVIVDTDIYDIVGISGDDNA